jgi:hypothetical protein
MPPVGLLPLCGPGFSAPRDLRLTIDGNAEKSDREANVFVASHLISLPFSWGKDVNFPSLFFRRVQRLQMSELNEDHRGLALEQLASVIRALPCLKRLGTVSSRSAKLLDLTSDSFHLEELVVVLEVDDIGTFYKDLIPLEQLKRRSTLRRLCIHFLAGDGVSRLKDDMEAAMLAGWHNIATNMLHPDGVISFSVATKQLLETSMVQLAWFLPIHFSLDATEYRNGRHPLSTPIDRSLPYLSTDGIVQPNGTLISGSLRPPFEPAGPWALASRQGKRPKGDFSWIGMSLVDSMDALLKVPD